MMTIKPRITAFRGLGWGDVGGIGLIMTAYFSRLTMVVACIGLLGCATQSGRNRHRLIHGMYHTSITFKGYFID